MAISDDDAGFAQAEENFKNFISDPARLATVRQALGNLGNTDADETLRALRKGLTGWLALFECNIIDSDAARHEMADLIKLESELFTKRRDLVLQHINDAGAMEDTTLSGLATNMSTNRSEAARKSSLDADAGLGELGFSQRIPGRSRKSATRLPEHRALQISLTTRWKRMNR